MKKNRFSELLETLMKKTEIKNYALAQFLQYDISYISKWVNGKMLPSEKMSDSIISKIALFLVENSSPEGIKELREDYSVIDEADLFNVLADHLKNEYDYVKNLKKNTGDEVAKQIYYYPTLSVLHFMEKMKHPFLRNVNNLNVITCVDLMILDDEYRYRIITSNNSSQNENYTYDKVHYILLLNLKINNVIQDANFITFILINYANVNFEMYNTTKADDKFVFAINQAYSAAGMLINNNECVSVTVCEDRDYSNKIYNKFKSYCLESNLMFSKVLNIVPDTNSIYIKYLLSMEKRCLVHKFNAFFIPVGIYEQIAPEELKQYAGTIKLIQSIMRSTEIQIIFTKNFFLNFILSGEIELFNQSLILNAEQRRECLNYLKNLIDINENMSVKIYDTKDEPSIDADILLSNALHLLQLYTKHIDNNMIKLKNPSMISLYEEYWEEINKLSKDANEVVKVIEATMNSLSFLIEGEDMIK